MKICFDVNVIIDLFAKSSEMPNAVFSYDIAVLRRFDVFVPASALADISYILHRRSLPKRKVRDAMAALFDLFECIDVNGSDGARALENGMHDYEDAVIAESCARNGIDLIITRNKKDFALSPVPAITPEDFVSTYKPPNYSYAECAI